MVSEGSVHGGLALLPLGLWQAGHHHFLMAGKQRHRKGLGHAPSDLTSTHQASPPQGSAIPQYYQGLVTYGPLRDI
jgi:hypothetical protein